VISWSTLSVPASAQLSRI